MFVSGERNGKIKFNKKNLSLRSQRVCATDEQCGKLRRWQRFPPHLSRPEIRPPENALLRLLIYMPVISPHFVLPWLLLTLSFSAAAEIELLAGVEERY